MVIIDYMRKLVLLAAALLTIVCGKAQNVQLHYDFGHALYDKDLHETCIYLPVVL